MIGRERQEEDGVDELAYVVDGENHPRVDDAEGVGQWETIGHLNTRVFLDQIPALSDGERAG